MIAIFKKEMRSYFTTPMGYIFLAVALFVSSFVFALTTYYQEEPTSNTGTYFTLLVFLLAILLPVLTMRSFSEEKRAKTDQLLFTSPVSIFSLVLGKFLAAVCMFLVYLGLSMINLIPIFATVAQGASQPNGSIIVGNIIAIILVGICFIAIGIFASALSENSAVSFIITLGILAGFLVINLFNSYIEIDWLRSVLSWLSIYGRFVNFTYGIFDIGALVYYISITGIFLFLTERIFQVRRLG
ncbi:MAG: ABC transporter permease subunit [Clostridia bacterium]|nr:ABC transporter permease subunit [Clostridia bacterium]